MKESEGYQIRLFQEQKFYRKQCPSCQRFFWTLDPDRKTCGDVPCNEYAFIGNPPIKQKYNIHDMREIFLKFFEEHNHTRIKRYPVVASRWRDDVYLTGASIYDFQPWVTSGQIPPPANPLTIAQPSIRFTDIDNVGRSGRHFTCFEMMAHHAFNSEQQKIYWMDETTEYCHKFLVDRLKLKPEEISYIEDFWEGGGNAGEDFEVLVCGLELATLVFMHYEKINGQYKELPLKIVDTGYGLERFVWLTHGTPSAYEATLGPAISKLKKLVGIEDIDKKILIENAKFAGLIDLKVSGNLRLLRSKVAEKAGLTVEELEKLVKPFEAIYTIADHSRCLAFMFGDGIVPSNVREGYLARLVLRRALKFMREIGLEIPLSEIVKIHIDDLGNDFPELKENERYILEIVGIEEKRYRETLARGRRLVEKTSDYLARENKTEMPIDMLVDLYDTHGLPPEIVKEVAESQGIKVTIPDDFYIKVGTRHAETRLETLIEPKKFEGKIKALPETKLLFYDSPYLIEFSAKVLDVFDGKFVVLDQTCFYPEGGGQPSDKGTLDGNEVVDVQKVGEIVVHEIKGKLNKGDAVQGKIDWNGRLALMRHHTSTHLLLGAARRVLGDHVWQHGAQKGIDRSRLDITHFEQIKPEDLKKIEQLANSVIMANKPVKIEWMARNEAEKKYGFRLYQGGVVPGKKIRVVKVEDWDVEACAGTHCLKTGEIGPFKITKTERIQDGVERIEFVSGEAAIKYFQQRDDLLQKIADVFRVAPEKALFAAERFFDEWKNMRKEVERLREQVAELRIYNLVSKAKQLKKIKLIAEIIPEADMGELIRTGAILTKHDPSIVTILFSKKDGVKICGLAGETALKSGASVREAVIMAAEIVGGKGGGRVYMAQGGGPKVEKLNEAIQKIIKYFSERH